VVCHGGVGSALEALDVGFCPVVVPRRARYGEHVDDHQVPLAQELGQRGLAIYREAEDVTYEDLVTAASRSVRLESRPPPFALN
jgi:UDP-N-acetylglucosamine transferase subunit ALG13